MFKKQLIAALVITVVVASLMATPVFAGNGNNGKSPSELPGWGYGDDNHEHSGPPGQVDSERPGWGYGDDNHEHYGAPGQVDTEKPGNGFGDANHEHTGAQNGNTKNK